MAKNIFLRRLFDFIIPPVCLSCQTSIDCHDALCPKCWRDISFIVEPRCDRLGIPLPFDIGEKTVSASALASPPKYDRARSVAGYDNTMRKLIHRFKYGDRHECLNLFGHWMAFAGRDILGTANLLVPVPLYPLRLWRRGFNQSSLLADYVAKRAGVPVNHFVLKRKKRTKSQVGLTWAQRKQNVAGAFGLDRKMRGIIRGCHIVIVDDVVTTGATVEACAQLLRKEGARKVDVLSLARVLDPVRLSI